MFPKLISFDDFFLPTYGVLVALAFLAAIAVTGRQARRAGLPQDKVTSLALYCALAGMLGAKLGMIFFDWKLFTQNPGELFSLSTLRAAGVFQTGLVLALVTAWGYMRAQQLPVLTTADVFAPGLALGHAIGRIGCFAAGCCWGTTCDRPWAVTFRSPAAEEISGVPLNVPLHPTQLYESGAEILIFVFLLWYSGKVPRPGSLIGWYLVLYSVARFGVEFFRHHEQGLVSGFSLTQWISAALFAAGLMLLVRASAAAFSSRRALRHGL
ncbi:MAG TPA: prolipoprotein diacylglyceryl transferase [Bryobacteraceae bacterium]|nr:prolipoprotein diacylglyceryl transferase [Bryobacteraceae bacterium]